MQYIYILCIKTNEREKEMRTNWEGIHYTVRRV